MIVLPEKFKQRMSMELPADEREAFFAVYDEAPVKGLRVNTLKTTAEAYGEISPFPLEKTPWAENGYYTTAEKVGGHPHHFAGLIYSQEPSAMAAAPLLEIAPGETVLDLCSAPGGKGTQMAAALKGEGLIVLNEPISSRSQILSSNVERLGVKNAVVLNEYPETLSAFFEGYFDKILVDAPCSGEGMFRKNEREAIGEWSEENVVLCAARQKKILAEATKMLKKGGRLVYSTCTFSSAEDEGQVSDYLASHPEMRLIKQEKLLPHKIKGEGHFVALFEKAGDATPAHVNELKPRVSAQSEKLYRAFEKEFFFAPFAKNLHEAGGVLYELPQGVFDWKRLHVVRAGVRLGEVKNSRFEPSHSLALCVQKAECKRTVDFACDDLRLEKYLCGETVEADGENGWCIVCADGYPVGLGKLVNGTVKNHIPKGVRKIK